LDDLAANCGERWLQSITKVTPADQHGNDDQLRFSQKFLLSADQTLLVVIALLMTGEEAAWLQWNPCLGGRWGLKGPEVARLLQPS